MSKIKQLIDGEMEKGNDILHPEFQKEMSDSKYDLDARAYLTSMDLEEEALNDFIRENCSGKLNLGGTKCPS